MLRGRLKNQLSSTRISANCHTITPDSPGLSGVIVWQFADVRVDESWFSSRPRCMNNKGLVDEYRRPKLAYAAVRELYRAR